MNDYEIIIPQNKQDLTNPSAIVKRDLPKYWDREYINERIDATVNHRHKMLLLFLWYSGVRVSEAIGLRKGDIDFQHFMMSVRWQKSRKYHTRVVPLHPKLKDLLHLYTATLKDSEYVFAYSRQRAWQIVQKCMDGSPHQFRHSFAVNWLRSGGDLVILSRMLGHNDIRTTMEYTRIVPVDQGKELLKIHFT